MAIVQSDGAIRSLESPVWWPAMRTGVQLYGELSQDYSTIWRTQPNVRLVVSFLARNIAQLAVKVYRRETDTDRVHLGDHGLAQLLRKPNPRTTKYRLVYGLVSDFATYDNAFWLKVKGETQGKVGVVRVPPARVSPLGESWLWADGYRVSGAKGFKDFTADEMVHFVGYDPEGSRWGVSPMETLRRILAEDAAAGEYREHFWQNAARMETVLTRPPEAPALSDAARDRLRLEWNELYSGGANSGKTAILEEGTKVENISFSAREAQYLETRKLSREEVAAAFHISPLFVGILEHANFSNVSEQHKHLYQDTLGPWLTMIEEDIELQLLPEFPDQDRVYVEFNLAEKLKGNFEEQLSSLQTAVGAPFMLRNEARARLNLPSLGPDGDQIVTPLNVLEGGQASPTDSAPPPKLRKFFERQAHVVMSKLAAGVPVEQAFRLDRWNRELSELVEDVSINEKTLERLRVIDGDPDLAAEWFKYLVDVESMQLGEDSQWIP